MLELLRQLIGLHGQDGSRFREVVPILKAILHSEALTEAVRATKSPVDDLVLRVLRALVPQE
jgi:hypothetical protein